LLLNTD
jgi:hypothetical protein